MSADHIGYGRLEFKSVGWPTRQSFFMRVALALALPLAAFAFLLDQSFWRDPWLLGFVIVFPIIMTLTITRMSKGTILLDHEGITLKASGRMVRTSWGDIEQMSLTSLAAREGIVVTINNLMGADVNKEFIELKLKKSLRINPVTENQSTRGWGIPTLFVRVTHLFPEDPRALLSAAEIHLQPGLHV